MTKTNRLASTIRAKNIPNIQEEEEEEEQRTNNQNTTTNNNMTVSETTPSSTSSTPETSILTTKDDSSKKTTPTTHEETFTGISLSNNNNNDKDGASKNHKKNKTQQQQRVQNKKKRSTGRRSDIDPDGFMSFSSQHGETYYKNQERNPLNNVTKFDENNNNQEEEQLEMEECELFSDTFTFMMTAKYPLDVCLNARKSAATKNDSINEQEAELKQHQPSRLEASRGSSTFLTDNNDKDKGGVDPDAWYLPFWTGFFVIGSQLFIYWVVLTNAFVRNSIPPNADVWLRVAQIFAVNITLYTQSDFIDGIFLVTERWRAFSEITTRFKFNLSAFLRILAGNVGILATFVLVMYSTEVVDLLLNFTAMEFVATLDGSAFELAAKGFLGNALEKKCLEIQEFRYQRKVRRGSFKRCCVYCLYVVLVFLGFVVVVSLQAKRSVGVDNEVYVQFDDSGVPELYGISGVYKGCKGFRSKHAGTGGIGYIDISQSCPELEAKSAQTKLLFPKRSFVYCWDLDGWAFIKDDTELPCADGNYLVRSFLDDPPVDSNSFDILTHAQANWIVARIELGGEAILDTFFIESAYSFESSFTYCGDEEGSGLVRTDKDTHSQTKLLPLPETTIYYPTFDGQLFRKVFGLMYRPIYQKKIPYQEHRYQVVVFDGLRWNRLYLNPLAFAQNITREDECNLFEDPECWFVFVKYFHIEQSWRSNFTVAVHDAISDPVMFLTPDDTGIPTADLIWYEARLVDGRILPGKIYGSENSNSGGNDEVDLFGFVCAQTLDLECPEIATSLLIDLDTDLYPHETHVLAFYGQELSDIGSLTTAEQVSVDDIKGYFDIPPVGGLVDLRFSKSVSGHLLGTCVPKMATSCVQIVIIDTFGDGIFEPGQYEITFGNTNPVGERDPDYWSCRSYQFGPDCVANTTQAQQPTNCDYTTDILANYPGDITGGTTSQVDPFSDVFLDSDFESTFVPTDHVISSTGDVDLPPPMLIPPIFEIFCEDTDVKMLIDFTTDSNPYQNSILIFYGQGWEDMFGMSSTDQITAYSPFYGFFIAEDVVTEFHFSGSDTTHEFEGCIPMDVPCIQIILLDTNGDGVDAPIPYELSFGDNAISGGQGTSGVGDSWGCRAYQFGNGCTNTPQFGGDFSNCSYDNVQDALP